MLAAWREAPFFTEKERAALEWTEAISKIDQRGVPDEVYQSVSKHFNERELVDLTLAVVTINGYNRFNIAFRTIPGSGQPLKVESKTSL